MAGPSKTVYPKLDVPDSLYQLLDRYEFARKHRTADQEHLRRQVSRAIYQIAHSLSIRHKGIAYRVDGGDLMRTVIGRFKHLLPDENCRVYKLALRERSDLCA